MWTPRAVAEVERSGIAAGAASFSGREPIALILASKPKPDNVLAMHA
jgi:hypothetical protein